MEAVLSFSNSEIDDLPMDQNEGWDYADTLVGEAYDPSMKMGGCL